MQVRNPSWSLFLATAYKYDDMCPAFLPVPRLAPTTTHLKGRTLELGDPVGLDLDPMTWPLSRLVLAVRVLDDYTVFVDGQLDAGEVELLG